MRGSFGAPFALTSFLPRRVCLLRRLLQFVRIVPLLGGGILCASETARAQTSVYRYVDDHGNVFFTDRGLFRGTKIDVPPLQTYHALHGANVTKAQTLTVDRSQRATTIQSSIDSGPGYASFEVLSPKHDEVVRNDAGNVDVALSLSPDLVTGHKIQIVLDGTPVGESDRMLMVTVANLDRGTHAISGRILGVDGNLLMATKPVTFHLKRRSVARLVDD